MEAKIYIEELEQDVTFSAKLIQVNGQDKFFVSLLPSEIRRASLTIDNIKWDETLYSKEENKIIAKYLPAAEIELFAEARQELMDALEI